jgi:hypothetical protein
VSRSAWVFAALGLAIIALLLSWMGKTLDSKAPIRIDRGGADSAAPARTPSAEELVARETAEMRALVARRAASLVRRAAEQAFSGEEAARARCTFTQATLVHRDGASAYWNAEFSCVDPRAPGSFPNLTSVSVRLNRDGERWVVEN